MKNCFLLKLIFKILAQEKTFIFKDFWNTATPHDVTPTWISAKFESWKKLLRIVLVTDSIAPLQGYKAKICLQKMSTVLYQGLLIQNENIRVVCLYSDFVLCLIVGSMTAKWLHLTISVHFTLPWYKSTPYISTRFAWSKKLYSASAGVCPLQLKSIKLNQISVRVKVNSSLLMKLMKFNDLFNKRSCLTGNKLKSI